MKPIRHVPVLPILVVLVASVCIYGLLTVEPQRGDTDPPTGFSGMNLHIDARTGCHYLSRSGGLTPRLQADGTHLCEVRP